jgi:hypothetical protein
MRRIATARRMLPRNEVGRHRAGELATLAAYDLCRGADAGGGCVPTALQYMVTLSTCRDLAVVVSNGADGGAHAVRAIAELLRTMCCNLRSLSLRHVKLSGASLRWLSAVLAGAPRHASLRYITVPGVSSLGTSGGLSDVDQIQCLGTALGGCPDLRRLAIHCCCIWRCRCFPLWATLLLPCGGAPRARPLRCCVHNAAVVPALVVAVARGCAGAVAAAEDLRVPRGCIGGRQLLHVAACQGHAALVRQLLAAGCDVDAADMHGATPLVAAASHSHAAGAVQLLLDAKCSANAADWDGLPAVEVAAQCCNVAVVRILLAAGCVVRREQLESMTLLLDGQGYADVAQMLRDAAS